ncbi:MAG: hypothetical protein WCI31_14100 [Prolixibacteraceae bacterium]
MENHDKFQLIGKKTPYEVPSGFFESIAEKTLKNAIKKVHIHKRNNVVRLIFSVAASLALLFYMGINFKQNSDAIQVQDLIVDRTRPASPSATPLSREITNHKKITEKVLPGETIEKDVTTLEKPELLSDILSDLTDEDLQQIAIRYKTDTFINESLQ